MATRTHLLSIVALALLTFVVPAFAAPASAQAPRVGDVCAQAETTVQLVFDLYQGRVEASESRLIDQLADRLRACPDQSFELQVHTDTVRMSSFNARQSRVVAEHLRELLAARGIPASRLAACGYGESNPVSRQPSWDGRAPNNRLIVRALPSGAAAHTCPSIR